MKRDVGRVLGPGHTRKHCGTLFPGKVPYKISHIISHIQNISYVNCLNFICETKISHEKLIFICESSISYVKCMFPALQFHV